VISVTTSSFHIVTVHSSAGVPSHSPQGPDSKHSTLREQPSDGAGDTVIAAADFQQAGTSQTPALRSIATVKSELNQARRELAWAQVGGAAKALTHRSVQWLAKHEAATTTGLCSLGIGGAVGGTVSLIVAAGFTSASPADPETAELLATAQRSAYAALGFYSGAALSLVTWSAANVARQSAPQAEQAFLKSIDDISGRKEKVNELTAELDALSVSLPEIPGLVDA
jgi:hypothetical protein